MNDTMEYKGYKAVVRFVPDDDIFHGSVVNVADTIHFAGKSVSELKRAFKDSVEDYLAFCKKRGEQPDKPYSGKLMVRLDAGRSSACGDCREATWRKSQWVHRRGAGRPNETR